jgi:hypothetical protein
MPLLILVHNIDAMH